MAKKINWPGLQKQKRPRRPSPHQRKINELIAERDNLHSERMKLQAKNASLNASLLEHQGRARTGDKIIAQTDERITKLVDLKEAEIKRLKTAINELLWLTTNKDEPDTLEEEDS